jgi:hypothetical protein
MGDARGAFVHEAELQLDAATDPAAVGAAVTTALCGHWDHEGPCRWPHNNRIEPAGAVASFRTLFVAPAADEDRIRERIEQGLQDGVGWDVLRSRSRQVSPSEEPLARRLATTPST